MIILDVAFKVKIQKVNLKDFVYEQYYELLKSEDHLASWLLCSKSETTSANLKELIIAANPSSSEI
jgi:hypothetical protein